MKVRTVGALAALGMLLTSYSVWSLTSDHGARQWRRTTSEWRDPPQGTGSEQTIGATFSAPGTLALDARLGHPRLPGSSTSETFVLVNVRADASATGRATKRHLAIAIDRSGSMAGKRLRNAVAAAQGAVQRL